MSKEQLQAITIPEFISKTKAEQLDFFHQLSEHLEEDLTLEENSEEDDDIMYEVS